MKTGISLYFSGGMDKNQLLIEKAVKHGVKYAFTSLHIPEETVTDYRRETLKLLSRCRDGNLNLIVDVGPETFEKLDVNSLEELKELGITHVRLDYGFTAEETVQISKSFYVVFNASTITEEEIACWKQYGADFTRFAACHNFYPKQYTALSLQRVKEINLRLKYLGFTTMAFVPGNAELRGPLYEGLPTVEEHRNRKEEVVLNMLELYYEGCCDVVLIGDVDIEENGWNRMKCLSENYVELCADILPAYGFIRNTIHHDRTDSSEYIIRSQESRQYNEKILPEALPGDFKIQGADTSVRKSGSIAISNQEYLRYMGELEIARVDLPMDGRLNIIGCVCEKDRKYLPYIQNGFGFKLL